MHIPSSKYLSMPKQAFDTSLINGTTGALAGASLGALSEYASSKFDDKRNYLRMIRRAITGGLMGGFFGSGFDNYKKIEQPNWSDEQKVVEYIMAHPGMKTFITKAGPAINALADRIRELTARNKDTVRVDADTPVGRIRFRYQKPH